MAHGTYFTFSYEINDLLFKGFSSSSIGGLIGFCLFVASLTLLYEGTKVFRQRLMNFSANRVKNGLNNERSADSESPKSDRTERSLLMKFREARVGATWSRTKFHLIQTVLYTIQTVLAYTLMLLIMSYNLWLALSIFLASGLAYFIFGMCTLTAPVTVPLEYLRQPADSHH